MYGDSGSYASSGPEEGREFRLSSEQFQVEPGYTLSTSNEPSHDVMQMTHVGRRTYPLFSQRQNSVESIPLSDTKSQYVQSATDRSKYSLVGRSSVQLDSNVRLNSQQLLRGGARRPVRPQIHGWPPGQQVTLDSQASPGASFPQSYDASFQHLPQRRRRRSNSLGDEAGHRSHLDPESVSGLGHVSPGQEVHGHHSSYPGRSRSSNQQSHHTSDLRRHVLESNFITDRNGSPQSFRQQPREDGGVTGERDTRGSCACGDVVGHDRLTVGGESHRSTQSTRPIAGTFISADNLQLISRSQRTIRRNMAYVHQQLLTSLQKIDDIEQRSRTNSDSSDSSDQKYLGYRL